MGLKFDIETSDYSNCSISCRPSHCDRINIYIDKYLIEIINLPRKLVTLQPVGDKGIDFHQGTEKRGKSNGFWYSIILSLPRGIITFMHVISKNSETGSWCSPHRKKKVKEKRPKFTSVTVWGRHTYKHNPRNITKILLGWPPLIHDIVVFHFPTMKKANPRPPLVSPSWWAKELKGLDHDKTKSPSSSQLVYCSRVAYTFSHVAISHSQLVLAPNVPYY